MRVTLNKNLNLNKITTNKATHKLNEKIQNNSLNPIILTVPNLQNLQAYSLAFAGKHRNSQYFQPFMVATALGNAKLVEQWLKDDLVCVNEANNSGVTPLLLAIDKNHKDIIDLLLSHKNIDINAQTIEGHTPLMLATVKKNNDIVDLLLNRDEIDVNLLDYKGNSALLLAAGHDSNGALERLLRHKDINPNIQDNEGRTALFYAFDNPEATKLLLQHDKIDINIPNNKGITPFEFAIIKGQKDTVAEYLKHKDIDVTKPLLNEYNAFGLAVSAKEPDVARLIYQHMQKNGLN